MTSAATITHLPSGAWTVTVQQRVGREQCFECRDEERARAFAQLFGAPERPRCQRAPAPAASSSAFPFRLGHVLSHWLAAFAERTAKAGPETARRARRFADPEIQVCRTTPWHDLRMPRWG